MNLRRNPRVLVTIIFAGLLILVLAGLFFWHERHNNGVGSAGYDSTHQGPDHAGPAMVNISGSSRLNQILLSGQFNAVMSELNSYILDSISPKTVSAQISNTVINNDGSVSFTVQTTSPVKQFTVNLDRSQYTSIGFSVPSTGFQASLTPY